jgi:hypothetical protein
MRDDDQEKLPLDGGWGPVGAVFSRKVCAVGSLRNPVGPLPSSIYWRRRGVLVAVVGVLALLVVWVVTSGGGGGKKDRGGSDGKNPAPSSITPGPSGTGPAISQHPGGRDESSGGDDGSGTGGTGGASGSGGTGSGSGTGTGGSTDGGTGSGGSATTGGNSAGGQLPADSTLPNCTASAVKLTLRSLHNSYDPEQTPTLRLTARNSASSDCKVDLGAEHTVLTITQTGSDDDFWASDDCPEASGSALFRVPAGGSATYTVKWDRKPSAPNCATPSGGSASAGTYLVEAKAAGFAKAQTSFVLTKD